MSDLTMIILADDGRHVSVGRHSEPTEDEISDSADALAAMGLGGWLCRMEGSYYRHGGVRLTALRTLGSPKTDFMIAEAKFAVIRVNA